MILYMSNIYRIINDTHIDEIKKNNKLQLIIISFTTKENETVCPIKKKFIELSKIYNNVIFLYIDTNDFVNNGSIVLDCIPTTIFYLDDNELCRVTKIGNHVNTFVEQFNIIISQWDYIISKKKSECSPPSQPTQQYQQTQNIPISSHNQISDILTKLNEYKNYKIQNEMKKTY